MTIIVTMHPFWGYVFYALLFASLIVVGSVWILGVYIHTQERRRTAVATARQHVPDAQWYALHRSPFVTDQP